MSGIWLFCLFGSEEELLPYFLKHYEGQVDRLVMMDGGAADRSREILATCEKAVVEDSPFKWGGYDEIFFVNYLAARCWEARGKADWVLAVDADEFLYAPEGLRKALNEYRRRGMRAVKAFGYQMTAESFPDADLPLTLLVRDGVYDREYDKVCAFDPALDLQWSPGRHNCRANAMLHQPGLKLLHYRYFGPDWLAKRNAKNYARRSADDIAAGRGYQVTPGYTGKYGQGWWEHLLKLSGRVVE